MEDMNIIADNAVIIQHFNRHNTMCVQLNTKLLAGDFTELMDMTIAVGEELRAILDEMLSLDIPLSVAVLATEKANRYAFVGEPVSVVDLASFVFDYTDRFEMYGGDLFLLTEEETDLYNRTRETHLMHTKLAKDFFDNQQVGSIGELMFEESADWEDIEDGTDELDEGERDFMDDIEDMDDLPF